MKVRTPDYYKEFRCIAGDCMDTCCAGWQVDVDDASFAYYKTIQGPFGERLRSVMIEPTKKAEGQFRICEDGRCPFLNDKKLCDLYAALGEEALCVTCDQYPRFTTEYGNLRETGIALSCLTAGELILRDNRRPVFVTREDENLYPSLNEIDGETYLAVMEARERVYEILADRTYCIWERMLMVLYLATDLQKVMKHPSRMKAVLARYQSDYLRKLIADTRREQMTGEALLGTYEQFWQFYMQQVIIKKEWPVLVGKVFHVLYEVPAPWEPEAKYAYRYPVVDVQERVNRFLEAYARTYEYENLMTYFVFRYFAKGILDGDVLTKVKLGIVSVLLITHCDAATWLDTGHLDFATQVDICHLYSRELEHSEENFAAIHKLMRKNRTFGVKKLALLLSRMGI